MRAAVVPAQGEFSIADDVDVPEPGPGEVLVRIVATGICHTDLAVLQGDLPAPMPIVLGHEGAGIVESVGPGVRSVRSGDYVVASIVNSCGECYQCFMGNLTLCEIGLNIGFGGSMMDGTTRLRRNGQPLYHLFCQSSFAEYAVVPARSVVSVRKDAPLDVVATLGCGAMTGIGAVIRRARASVGSSMTIIGAGGVGLAALLGSRASGCTPIIVADLQQHRLEYAEELGATRAVNVREDDVTSVVQSMTGRGTDYAIDAVGAPGTLEQAWECVRPGGDVVAAGMMNLTMTSTLDTYSMIFQKRVTGTALGSINPHVDIPPTIDLFMDGRLPLDKLVTKRYALDEIPKAFEHMESGELIGRGVVILDPSAV